MKTHPYFLLPLFLIMAGCGLEVKGFKVSSTLNQVVSQSVTNNEVKDIAEAMSDISNNDALVIYKQFAGLAEFIENTKQMDSTAKVDKTIGMFQGIYSLKSSNEKWLNFIEGWLKNKGYDDVKLIVDDVKDEKKEISRKQIVADFRILAEGAKLKLEQGNAVSK